MKFFFDEWRFLNPHSESSGITYLYYPGKNGEEMPDLRAFEVLEYVWKVSANRKFLLQLLHANLVIMGNHTAHGAKCGTKGLLDYLLLPLIARKIIGDFLLQYKECSEENVRTHIDLYLKILFIPALAIEIARYAVGMALTLLSVPFILLNNLYISCRGLRQKQKGQIDSNESYFVTVKYCLGNYQGCPI